MRFNQDDEALNKYKGLEEIPPAKRAVEKSMEASTKANKAVKSAINQVFSLYSSPLMEEAGHPWKKIVSKQVTCVLWMGLHGEEHPTEHEQSWGHSDYINFHLLTVFSNDTAQN